MVSIGLVAWALAAVVYVSAPGAKADSGEKFRDVETVFLVPQDGQWYTVKIGFFMFDNGDGNFDQAADTARTEMLARFPGALEVPPDSVSAQYVLSGFKWMSNPSWTYNGDGSHAGVAGTARTSMQAAANTWGTASGGAIALTGGFPSTEGTGACGGGGTNGENTVGWGAQSGSVLAVTCSWFSNNGNPKPAVEFDMEFDPDWNWTTGNSPQIDVQSVALHEFGHALGLNHSATSAAVMFASYSSGSLKRTPHADDIAGLEALYGGGGAGPTNTPTATNTPIPTATPTTPGATPTNTPTPTPTPTQAANPTNTPTPTPNQGGGGPTSTPVPPTPTPTRTPTPGNGGGNSPTATATSTATATPTSTNTPTPTVGASATPTRTPTPGTGAPPSLPIVPGANLFAWPGNDLPPAVALAGASSNLKIVYAWDPITQSWSRYAPGLPGYLNNLTTMKKGSAYWFIATGSTQIAFQP